MHRKKIWQLCTALLLLVTVLAFAGCKQKQEPASTEPAVTQAPTTVPVPTEPEPTEPPQPVDYDNGVVRKPFTLDKVLLENDFSAELDPTVTLEYHYTSWYGSTATLEDGWLHLTSSEHLFTFGSHYYGAYGGLRFETGKTYTVSFDLKRGSDFSNNAFTLTLSEEAEGKDPRFGDQLKQVVIDFDNYEEMVAFNSDKGTFAAVSYKADTGICHVEVQFTVERGDNSYLLTSRNTMGLNDWYLDNLYIAQITPEVSDFQWVVEDTDPTYDCKVNTNRGGYTVRKELLNEKFRTSGSIKLENGGRTAFFGPSGKYVDGGMARITSSQHIFTFGRYRNWANFGGVEFQKGHSYVMSFDVKLGDARTQKVFNVYVMKDTDPDPRFGTPIYTLTMDFTDLYRPMNEGEENYFVKENTNGFASVKYNSETRIAHVELRFKRSGSTGIVVVSKGMGDNEWLFDNFYIADITPPVKVETQDYDNGIRFDDYEVKSVLFENDFAEDANKGVVNEWQRSAFHGSEVTLEEGMARLISPEHLFVWGKHSWGQYGGFGFTAGATYKMSFDLRLGNNNANRIFQLYVMTENGDPRYSDAYKTLTLDLMDFEKLVTKNTDDFASVVYSKEEDLIHIEILFTAHAEKNTIVVSTCRGDNNWLIDNVKFEEVSRICPGHQDENGDNVCDLCGRELIADQDYTNGVIFEGYEAVETVLENDFAENADKGVTQAWHKSAFYGPTALLEDGWVHLTSNEQVFVLGSHTWGAYGGVSFNQDCYYKVSYDLKLGHEDSIREFTVYITTEGDDPRYGTAYKTLKLNFGDFVNFVTENTDDFASVTYSADTKTAHIEMLFKTHAEIKTQISARQAGVNDWLMDNLKIEKMQYVCPGHVDENADGLCDLCGQELNVVPEKDYDNGISHEDYDVVATLFENDFSEDANKGVTQAWHKSSFFGSTATLEDGWVRINSSEHLFVYGGHSWGNYGGFGYALNTTYKVSFDLQLGDDEANKAFNLYVMTENGDPRFGTMVKTLTLNFADFENFVAANTDDFASVTYTAASHTAHIEMVFTTDASLKTQLVSRCAGTNNWLLDNLTMEAVTPRQVAADYDNGISFADKTVESVLFENDYSESVDKGAAKTGYWGSTPAMEDGWLRLTSTEHVFVFGHHAWGIYGGVDMAKDTEYKVSFDLKLGAEDANKVFNLYVMSENGDPRFGTIVKTLTLDFSNINALVTTNTDNFASVTYQATTGIAHIEVVFTTDGAKNTQLASRCNGSNNWLLDNLSFGKVAEPVSDYDNGISFADMTVEAVLFENDYAESVDKDAARTGYWGSTAALENGWLRLTSTEHVFVFGRHAWGIFGGADMAKSTEHKVSFDLKLGADDANKTFHLYVMAEKSGADPRWGDAYKTLTLNFADPNNLVTVNTDDFASVTYNAQTGIAHIEVIFTTDAAVNTQIVSRCTGTNNWLLDNLSFGKVAQTAKDYDNGISFADKTVESVLFENDYSESVDKDAARTGYWGATAVLEDGWLRLTSTEHVFVFGRHAWAIFGGVDMAKATEYKVSFDLKLGAADTNKVFNLYVMSENGDPRFGNIVKTLTLNFSDTNNLVTANTGDFASVTYKVDSGIAHIEVVFVTDSSVNTQLVSRLNGKNNWLIDNLKFEKIVLP